MKSLRLASLSLAIVLLSAGNAVSVAQERPKITVTAPAAWLRAAPVLTAQRTHPIAKGQFYEVTARTADGGWWQLNLPNGRADAWMFADLGVLYSGDLARVPIVTPTLPLSQRSARPTTRQPRFPSWIPTITPRHRAIYQNSVQRGKDLTMFTVVADCNSMPAVHVHRVATGEFDTSRLEPRLQAVVQRFWRSFGRVSLAAAGGHGAASVMDPLWSDGALCDVKRGQTPLECELWVSRASVVFIALGTKEQYTWREFEDNYRLVVERTLREGVLPVLVTKADDLEAFNGAPSQHINTVIRKLAREYDVPLLDFWAATRELPNNGLIDEGERDFHLSTAGKDRRMLVTLQTLAALIEP